MIPAKQNQFFIAGGSLDADTPSYVERSADAELLERVQSGAFCYVLTARQMGKSSLMVRTAAKLREQGFKTALVDLASIGTASPDAWYVSILTQISRQLQVQTDTQAWWQNKSLLSTSQRFTEFLHDVILRKVSEQVVLFIDEIDVMLRLDFRDDFFAAIRSIHNARAKDPLYRRLTFVLLGVATPIDLVRDPRRTPFNIGSSIELGEFNPRHVIPLLKGLENRYPHQGAQLLRYIFNWTSGHPYLTQRLCLAVANAAKDTQWDEAQVERLVYDCFLSERAARDENLAFVRNSVASVAEDERQEMLAIYRAVYDGRPVDDDESSPAQNHLELFGLVRIERGKIHVRNEIYRRVFDKEWIQSQLPKQQRSSWFLPGIIAILAIILLGGGFAGARAIGLIGGSTPTSITVIDTPTVATTAPPVDTTPAPPTIEAMTPEPPTDTPTPSLVPTKTPTRTITPTPTDALPATNTSTPTATNTPIPIANCVAQSAVTIRQSPNGASTGRGLENGTRFSPEAKDSQINTFVWVKIPGSGWVYAGTSPKLVSCTGLENVPLIENP